MKQSVIMLLLSFTYLNIAGKSIITLPFILTDNQIIVQIETNSCPMNFIFDTASNLSVIDSLIAIKLNLQFESKIMYSTVSGRSVPAYYTNFNLNDKLPDLRWCIADIDFSTEQNLCKISGMIGASDIIFNNIL